MTTTALQVLDLSLPLGNLDAYIQRVNQIPLLTLKEERKLAMRLWKHKDLEAAQQLVLAHLRFVVKVAKTYRGYGLSLADLIQEGNIGLMKAVKRFDPKKGVRLVSFAIHWIKAEIHEFVIKNFRIVKVATTKAQRKLFFNLRQFKKQLGWMKSQEVDDLATHLDVKQETVIDMESRLAGQDISFDKENSASEECFAPEEYLSDMSMNPVLLLENDEKTKNTHQLYRVFDQLDSRSQAILKKRWLTDSKATLCDLAKEYHVSAERIRQLEQQAIQKLKNLLQRENVSLA